MWVRVSLRWPERPISIQNFEELIGIGLHANIDVTVLFILGSMVWSLWKTQNDWVFNNQLIKNPKAIAHKILGFLSQWKKLLKSMETDKVDDLMKKLQEGLI